MTWLPGKLPYSRFLEKNNKEFETGNNELLTTRINKNRKGQIISVLLMLPNWELQVQQDGVVKLQERDGPGAAHLSAPALLGDVWQITKIATGHEFVYGLGESTSTLALNGSQHEFWNTSPSGSYGKGEKHLYMKIPVLISSGQHGSHLVFFENSHKGSATISQSGTTTVKFAAGALRIFCFTGPPDSLIKSYTKLTGRPSLPPAWSLGFHQCRWGYQSEDDLINILEGFEENALPLQALHQDID